MGYGKRLAIIGIDGATFDIILPMVEKGELPTLGRLMKAGVYGDLNSTIPPMTPPAWSSFATGLNPGKHGIFDFTERITGTYSIRFVNASMRNGNGMWTIASEFGKRVAVMAVPFTYPPDKVNGVMISGIDAPGVGAKGDPSIMYPIQLYSELVKHVGPYIIASSPMNDIYAGNMKSALDKVLEAVERKGDSAKYLLQMDDWDLFIMVFGETDLVGHHFWKYHDPNSPFYEETIPDVNNAVKTVYSKIDRKIGEMLSLLPSDISVMIVSDHGFGGNNDIIVCLNKVLEEMGFLKFKSFSGTGYLSAYILNKVKKFGLKLTPPFLKKKLVGYRDPITGSPIINAARNREEVYNGSCVKKAPDVVLDWNNPNGYSYISRPSLYSKNKSPIRRLTKEEMKADRFRNKTGNHRQYGVFIASGEVFKKGGSIQGAEIIDIAPTALYIQGVPIPNVIDGKILTQAIRPEFLADLEPVFSEESQDDKETVSPYTEEESEIIGKRLKDLGYLE